MLFPFGDEPNDPKRVPWMNYLLIGANVLLFALIRLGARDDASFQEAIWKWGYTPTSGETYTLLSSMFMHAGWLHLGGNMLFLWIFGDNLEGRLGPLGYLVVYLALGVAATLTFGFFNKDSTLPLVGASGAISGVQGLYFIACPKHRVKVFLWLYFYISVFKVPAQLIMGFWFVLNDVVPILMRLPGNVAHAAHLGGFGAGLILMLLLRPIAKRVEMEEAGRLSHTHRYRGGHATRYDRKRRGRGPRP